MEDIKTPDYIGGIGSFQTRPYKDAVFGRRERNLHLHRTGALPDLITVSVTRVHSESFKIKQQVLIDLRFVPKQFQDIASVTICIKKRVNERVERNCV